jgi:hypothetical protein
MPHLEDAPRRAGVDPQRLDQRPVERGAMVTEFPPQLLLLLSISEGGRLVDAPHYRGRVAVTPQVFNYRH